MIAPLPATEADRLAALRRTALLDTLPESEYDDLTRLAADICQTPIALVSLIDADRQWFKAKVGLDVCETGRDVAFCAHAILGPDLLDVPDATRDDRFRDNPLVVGPPGIRFYAGQPLVTPAGFAIGTLCVIDTVPRTLTPAQKHALRVLARQVTAHVTLRLHLAELEHAATERKAMDERFRAFMDHGPAAAFLKDEAGRHIYVNEPIARRFGRPACEWLGKTDHDLHPAQADALRAVDEQVLATGTPVSLRESVPLANGDTRVWQVCKFPLVGPDGQKYLGGLGLDVTEQAATERALEESEDRFRNVVERLTDAVFLMDPDTRRVVQANRAFRDLLGYAADEVAALTQYDFVAHDRADIDRHVAGVIRDGEHDFGERRYRRKDGTLVEVRVRGCLLTLRGRPLVSMVVQNLTERKRYERQLHEYQKELEAANVRLKAIALTDGLTGLKNRTAFRDKLSDEFERAVRYYRPLSLLLIDIDHFKGFNDAYGQPAGDEVLRRVADVLTTAVRTTDFVARFGGEEFAVILPDTEYAGALVLGERVRQAVANAPWAQRTVTISVGAATFGPDTPDTNALVGQADAALFEAKRAGRNRLSHGSGLVGAAATRRAAT